MRSIPADSPDTAPVLALEELSVGFETRRGSLRAVRNLSLEVRAGECVGIVGESGAGKSQAFLAAMGLLAPNATVSGRARFRGTELLEPTGAALRRLRGAELSMIFQDPMTSLTPHMRIGAQIAEPLVRHRGVSRQVGRQRALELLRLVNVTDPEVRLDQYPHELSGGMRQRVMIAIALACEPRLLIADEPTTALDVTVQAQILALLASLKRERAMAMVLISHDLGVIAGLADRIGVMYAGSLVEQGTAAAVLGAPRHPYTRALLDSMPRIDAVPGGRLATIPGQPPDPRELPAGCAFQPRCGRAEARCRIERPALERDDDGLVACLRPLPGRSMRSAG